jgi:CPA2 family monovalent cation:H+ antiporter-2
VGQSVLTEVVTLVLAGAGIAYVCFRLGLVPIVGFLVAGVTIGPHALGLVRDPGLVDAAAEMGVILLLFTIGIEFSLERLAAMKRAIFVGGGVQVVLASLATVAILLPFGVPWRSGLFTGFLVALSSTVIVLKLLADRNETTTVPGRTALGILVFQDLAVVLMVLLVPVLAGSGGSGRAVVWVLAKAAGIVAVVLVVARRLMPAVLEQVARTCSPELFLLTVIAICFGTAFLTNLAGVSLSLGAFLAGLVVSESRFSQHALGEILPLQIIFSAIFFVSVGMLLDLRFLGSHLPLVAAGIAAVVLVKVVSGGLSVLALGEPFPVVIATALMLVQVGEFSFVLERAGGAMGLSPAGLGSAGSQAFVTATVVLMVLTPLLTGLGGRAARRLSRARPTEQAPPPAEPGRPRRANHVVVAGYGQAARRLVRVLDGSRIPFVITTLSPEGAEEAERDGLPVLRGDASRQHTLLRADADRAKVLVVADDDPAMAHRVAAVARLVNPTMRIVVRTRYIAEMEPLAVAGADRVIAEELESVVQLFADVMRSYELPADEIERHEDAVRRGGYAALRAVARPSTPVVECELGADCFGRRTVTVRAGMPAAALTVGEVPLVVERLRRDGIERPHPPRGESLRAGDELVLASSAEAFAHAAPLFRLGTLDGAALAEATADVRTVVDTDRTVELHPSPDAGCAHLDQIRPVRPSARGCEDCLRTGDRWVHLRICMTCGHVGCCDSSPNRHATAHHGATAHPVIRSLEPGEAWGWCYGDRLLLEDGGRRATSPPGS